jgi:hypothetical protein
MVMNSFGKRNFMQPMGRPKHAIKVPCFFLVSFGGGEGWGGGVEGVFKRLGSWFPNLSMVPNVFHVPFKFPMDSHQVPNMFPNVFSIAPHFDPLCFGKCCPPLVYIGGPKGRNSILQNRTFYFGCPHSFI